MMNKIVEGREYLEAHEAGSYARFVQMALEANGVVHLAPDCLLIGAPCADAPRTLYILFQCSQLGALHRVLKALSSSYDKVRWARCWKHDYGTRERDIADFARHGDLIGRISKD